MRALDIVMKKREGEPLSRGGISFLIRGYVYGSIPAYQTAAFLIAVSFQGMTPASAAARGLEAAMMSGRSLCHTHGIDELSAL